MSTDNRVLSSSHENLFGGRQSILPSEIYGLHQNRSRVSVGCPSDSDFDQFIRVKGLFGFHDFKPAFNGLFDIGNGFFISRSLRKTAGKGRHFSNIVPCFVLFYYYMKFHSASFLSVVLEIYHTDNRTVKNPLCGKEGVGGVNLNVIPAPDS